MVGRNSSAGQLPESTSPSGGGGHQPTSAVGRVTRNNVRVVRVKVEFVLPALSETRYGQAMTTANPVDAVSQGVLQQNAESTESKGSVESSTGAGLQQQSPDRGSTK